MIDPSSVPLAGQRYGPGGTCWDSDAATAQTCNTECIDGVDRLCSTDSASDSGNSTTGEPGPPPCQLSTLAPDAQTWLVAGEDEGELPTEIGDIIDRNCGCHLTDNTEFPANTPLYYGNVRIATWDDFHANYGGREVYEEVASRVLIELSMPPLFFCGDPSGTGSAMSEDDHALFGAWLDAGAPDAPTWAGGTGGSTG
jgi:hypothetical protein